MQNAEWQLHAGKTTKTNQYSVTEYDTIVHKGEMQMPSVMFMYDMSPISVTITETRKSYAHLLVRFCAVVGGVFAVTGTSCSLAPGKIARHSQAGSSAAYIAYSCAAVQQCASSGSCKQGHRWPCKAPCFGTMLHQCCRRAQMLLF